MIMIKSIFVIAVCLLASFIGLGQQDTNKLEVLSPAGDFDNNGSYAISWTLGEPIIDTKGDAKYFVTQGFHQTDWAVVAIWEYTPEEVEMRLYPNPMAQYLNLNIPSFDEGNKQYELTVHDFVYRPVFRATIESAESTFFLDYLPNGTYLMNVTDENGELVKSFKVVKNQ